MAIPSRTIVVAVGIAIIGLLVGGGVAAATVQPRMSASGHAATSRVASGTSAPRPSPPTSPASASTFDLIGSVSLGPFSQNAWVSLSSTACAASPKYADLLHAGVPVVVTDSDGKTLASVALVAGMKVAGACEFTFYAGIVPYRDLYIVRVQGLTETTFTGEQASTENVTINLLGG